MSGLPRQHLLAWISLTTLIILGSFTPAVGFVGSAAAAGPTIIPSCQFIDTPGRYELAGDITNANDVRILTHQITPDTIDSLFEHADEQSVRAVVTPSVIETLLEDDLLGPKTTTLLGNTVTVRILDGVQFVLAMCDDLVGMGVPDQTGAPTAVIESHHHDVLAWANETFEAHWARAASLDTTKLDRGLL